MHPIEKFNFKYNYRFPPHGTHNGAIDLMIQMCEHGTSRQSPSPNLANELRAFKLVNGRKWFEPLMEIN